MPPNVKRLREKGLAVQKAYEESGRSGKSNVLTYGEYGTGKTTFLSTFPKPIWIASFDPGGTTTRALQEDIKRGDIIVEDFSGDSWKQPRKFLEWQNSYEQLRADGMFEHVGTYAIDSLTEWSKCMLFESLKLPHKGSSKSRTGAIPEQRDYLVMLLSCLEYLGKVCDIPCHVCCTGHVAKYHNAVSGATETGLLMMGQALPQNIPLIFDEKYLLLKKETASGEDYLVQTHRDGMYGAETRMGGDVFDKYEEPNFKALLKKAGRDDSDRPPIFHADYADPVLPGSGNNSNK